MTDDLYYRKLESTPTIDLVDMIREKDKRIAELEAQIEEIKCCYNCANDTLEPPEVIGNGICEHCTNHDKWELEY